ncbi:MAG: acyltransferase [Prevotella sp.]|nr:acyltransferase [Prevotella sp.]
MRGIAILAIMLHNYCHYVKGIVKENEFQFLDGHCDRLWDALSSPDEFLPMDLLSFFGHYGVPVFLFLSGFGLVRTYESSSDFSKGQDGLQGKECAAGNPSPGESWWSFLSYHYLKLLRMLIVGFVLFLMVDAVTPGRFPFHWDNVIAQQLMYINVLPEPDKIIWPGIYWFFGLMFEFYIVYRLLLYRRSSWLVVAMIAACWLLQVFCDPDGDAINRLRYNFIGGMLPFGLGMLVARALQSSVKDRNWLHRLFPADNPLLWGGWLAFSVALSIAMSFNFHFWLWIPVVIIIGTIAMVKVMPEFMKKFFIFFGTYSAAMFVAHPIARKLFITVAWQRDAYDGLMLYFVAAIGLAWAVKQVIDRIPSPKR